MMTEVFESSDMAQKALSVVQTTRATDARVEEFINEWGGRRFRLTWEVREWPPEDAPARLLVTALARLDRAEALEKHLRSNPMLRGDRAWNTVRSMRDSSRTTIRSYGRPFGLEA